MQAEFISPEDLRWPKFLRSTPHDVYHLPEYVAFCAKCEGGRPAAFYAEAEDSAFLCPLVIRKIPADRGAPDDWCDATTPYGYPTPILKSPNNSSSLSHFLAAFQDAGAEYGIVSAFFRLHPFLALSYEVLAQYGVLVKRGQTAYIDLSLPLEDIESQMRHGHRDNVRKLIQSGFQATMDDWKAYEDFVQLYRLTMRRVSARDYYFFSDQYFEDLRLSLGDHLHLCTVASPGGDLAAAGLFFVTDGIVQYHLSGTSEEYVREAPTKLMLDSVTRWAKETGNRLFHLGGGVGGASDSLFQFKAGFSKLRTDFYTYRMILSPERYHLLVRHSSAQSEGVSPDDSDYFPAYRDTRHTR